ncbi:MAG: BlaI/MecI/CopY family transcriptional regulator [Oscillospiraceae bacterium]|nr:BlaI/MecI/CopY family transcriptional regulator [Oscillospiraceae bacterium]
MSISDSEQKLMEIIWENEPVKSGSIVLIANEKFGWKKSTVYTVIKKLTEKGFIISENAVISSLRQRDEVLGEKTEKLISKGFGGSLPLFLTAFLSREKLTREEAEELKKLIDEAVEP